MANPDNYDFSGLLTNAPPPAAWTKANEERGSIAARIGVKVATFAMRQRAARST